ncbi:hypothetical protein HDU76_003939 [Blyttiomyces sp. JEL0837]|nr:hypothetical protein HDU76_003939 [Blyttiomyces sp. JEL0837]
MEHSYSANDIESPPLPLPTSPNNASIDDVSSSVGASFMLDSKNDLNCVDIDGGQTSPSRGGGRGGGGNGNGDSMLKINTGGVGGGGGGGGGGYDGKSSAGVEETKDFLAQRTIAEQFLNIAFSVLFFMAHGNETSQIIEYIAIIVEDLQIVAYYLGNEVNHSYLLPETFQTLFKLIDPNYQDLNTTYRNIMVLAAVAVFLMVINILFVAYGFMIGQQQLIWPIRTLRFMATFLPTVLFALTCNRVDTMLEIDPPTLQNTPCSDEHRSTYVVLSSIALFFYVPLSLSVAAVFFDTNPTLKKPSNKLHGRTDIIFLSLKIITILIFKFLSDDLYLLKTFSVIMLSIIMFGTILYYFPYYNVRINQLRGGFYFSALLTGLVSFACGIVRQVTGHAVGYEGFSLMAVVFFGGFVIGFYLTGYVYNRIHLYVQTRLARYPTESNEETDFCVFYLWPHVEIAARVISHNMNHRRQKFKQADYNMMVKLFERGLLEFPDEPHLRTAYAIYQQFFTKDSYKAARLLSRVKMMNPALDMQFQVYYASQINNQSKEADFLGLHVRLDVASYAEFRKIDFGAKINHFRAVQDIKSMWKLVKDRHFKIEELSKIMARLNSHAALSENAYARLAAKFPNSKVILRYYARFCYDVTNDLLKAENLTSHADELEDDSPQGGITSPERQNQLNQLNRRGTKKRYQSPSRSQMQLSKRSFNDLGSPMDGGMEVSGDNLAIGSPTHSRTQLKRQNSRMASQQLTRIEDEKSSGASEMSGFDSKRRAQAAAQRLRQQILESRAFRVKFFIFFKALVILGLCIANFVKVESLLNTAKESITKLSWYGDRSYYTAMEFTRVRQMQNTKDPAVFASIQNKLYQEMQNFSKVEDSTYVNRDKSNALADSYDTVPSIKMYLSNYPQFYVMNGLMLANMSMKDFQANSAHLNEVRYILDNYEDAIGAYKYAVDDILLKGVADQTTNANTMVYAFTGTLIAVYVMFVFAVDLIFGRFQKIQEVSLDVFRHLPRDVISHHLQELAESDSEDIFPSSIIKHAESKDEKVSTWSRSVFRAFVLITCLTLTAISVAFAIFNLNGFVQIGINFGLIDEVSILRQFGVRAYNGAHECFVNGYFDFQTWKTPEAMVTSFASNTWTLIDGLTVILYGDKKRNPPTPSYDQLPPTVVDLLLHEDCLPFNQTLCNPGIRVYNSSINYLPAVLNQGLIYISGHFSTVLYGLASACARGKGIDPGRLELLDKLIEPDFLDGWQQFKMRIMDENYNVYLKYLTIDYLLFGLQIVIVVLSTCLEIYMVGKMMGNYKFIDQCIFGILSSLPMHVRQIPEIATYLKESGGSVDELIVESASDLSEHKDTSFKGRLKTFFNKKGNDITTSAWGVLGLGHRTSVTLPSREPDTKARAAAATAAMNKKDVELESTKPLQREASVKKVVIKSSNVSLDKSPVFEKDMSKDAKRVSISVPGEPAPPIRNSADLASARKSNKPGKDDKFDDSLQVTSANF